LATARYGVYPEPRQLASWQAENPAQQICARFTPEGVQVEAKSGDGVPQRIGMKLRSVGYGERTIGVSAARMTTSGSRIEYRRPLVGSDSAAGAITEWYVSTAAGLEQGFTVESAPGERRDGERLRVVLALQGDLRAQAVDDGQALEFKDGVGQRVLRYARRAAGHTAWDLGSPLNTVTWYFQIVAAEIRVIDCDNDLDLTPVQRVARMLNKGLAESSIRASALPTVQQPGLYLDLALLGDLTE
jgi:hypothetical protein